jgi:hypothetical protein
VTQQLDIILAPRLLCEPDAPFRLIVPRPDLSRTKILDDDGWEADDLLQQAMPADGQILHATIHFPINAAPLEGRPDQNTVIERRDAYRDWLSSLGIPFSMHPISIRC